MHSIRNSIDYSIRTVSNQVVHDHLKQSQFSRGTQYLPTSDELTTPKRGVKRPSQLEDSQSLYSVDRPRFHISETSSQQNYSQNHYQLPPIGDSPTRSVPQPYKVTKTQSWKGGLPSSSNNNPNYPIIKSHYRPHNLNSYQHTDTTLISKH
jgi:hypothetical protein